MSATYCESLHDMLPRCDFVAVSCPLVANTTHLLSSREFKLMKSSAVLVNVARGESDDVSHYTQNGGITVFGSRVVKQ